MIQDKKMFWTGVAFIAVAVVMFANVATAETVVTEKQIGAVNVARATAECGFELTDEMYPAVDGILGSMNDEEQKAAYASSQRSIDFLGIDAWCEAIDKADVDSKEISMWKHNKGVTS